MMPGEQLVRTLIADIQARLTLLEWLVAQGKIGPLYWHYRRRWLIKDFEHAQAVARRWGFPDQGHAQRHLRRCSSQGRPAN